MAFQLPPLPYSLNALEPVISSRTLEFHYHKHHKGYVDKTNKLIQGTAYENLSLEDVIVQSAENVHENEIFNNASQIWNHTFFWQSLTPHGLNPSSAMKDALVDNFGSVDEFKKQLAEAATQRFGSGYAWLIQTPENRLEVISTANAENPLLTPAKPLLALDIWEHAYYLDYQNERPRFVAAVIDRLLNWDFIEENWSEVRQARPGRSYSAASRLHH